MYEEKIAEVIEILQENSALWLKKKDLFFRKHKAKASGIRQKHQVIVVKRCNHLQSPKPTRQNPQY